MNNRRRSRFFDLAIVRSRRSIRFTGRKLDMCSTRNSSVRPRSLRTSARLLLGLFGVKKFGITSIGLFKRKVMRNVHSMEMKIVLRQVQPNGLSVTEEINFVTAPR